MFTNKIYNVGIYIRLSREDEDKRKNESESITNQRNLILNYINRSDEKFKIYDEYVDDGVSGTTFERPNFQRLIKDIENDKINCVITKDYSRLGRDYIKSGEYLERYFPEHNVRYIAILDNIDTISDNAGNDIAPYRAILNDQYAKDISKKVRGSVYTKKSNGEFLGWKAIYGYKKDEKNKNKIVIDEEAAKVVRRIFKMAYNGKSYKTIADTLSKECIPIPSVYANLNRGRKSSAYGLWSPRTIDEMLSNQTYIGNLTQGRKKRINYKIKKEVRVPQSEWIIVENTHEPIIDKKTFNKVQLLKQRNKNKQSKSNNYLLRGFIFCEECKHQITICKRTETRAYTSCSYYQKYSKFKVCTPHTMNYQDLEKEVLKKIKTICRKYIDSTNFESILKNSSKTKKIKNNLIGEINACKLEKERLSNVKKNIYFDKANNVITLDDYIEYSNQIVNDITIQDKKLKDLEKQLNIIDNKITPDDDYKVIVQEYLSMRKPSRFLLASIIDKIVINNNKEITIKLKIKNPELYLKELSTKQSALKNI